MSAQRSSAVALRLEAVRLDLGGLTMRFDLDVAPGIILAVTGPSGAGKTTLLNVIAGFVRPEAGRVLIADVDVTHLDAAQRPVSMIFQENNLFAHLDVGINVGLGRDPALRLSAADWADIDAALARVGLDGFRRRQPGQLSGGERQRVALARAIVRDRPVLLLDEPFAALGPGMRADMLALVRDVKRERGLTVIMVTHVPEDASALADRVAFLADGAIIAVGDSHDFFQRTDVAGLKAYLGRSGGTPDADDGNERSDGPG